MFGNMPDSVYPRLRAYAPCCKARIAVFVRVNRIATTGCEFLPDLCSCSEQKVVEIEFFNRRCAVTRTQAPDLLALVGW